MRKAIWVILLLAFALRLVGLSVRPQGFTPDEASFGYDAYSFASTGKDQWGRTFPLVLESHGDYKSPLYAYLAIPSVFVLGLSKLSTRLPNGVLGSLAIYATYLLFTVLVKGKNGPKYGIIAAGMLAISPWHIMMSRGAFEANLTTFFLPLGTYLFIKGLDEPKKLVWASVVFGLNLFTYHSAKLVTPLIVVALCVLFVKKLVKVKKSHLVYSLAIFSILLGVTGYTLFLGAGSRAADINIYKGALQEASPERLVAINKGVNPTIARLMHNKYQVTARRFFLNYKQYFSAKFLFLDGPTEATYGMLPGTGVLYWFELPLIIGFLLFAYKNKKLKQLWIIVFWILVAPVPAALSVGRGYAGNRTVIMLPAIQIALTLGAMQLVTLFKKKLKPKLMKYMLVGYGVLVLLSFIDLVSNYFVNPGSVSAKAMLQGNLEAAEWLNENIDRSREIVVSRKLSEPQIYIAFASKWDPADFQANTSGWARYKEQGLLFLDQLGQYGLGNYTFGDIDFSVSGKAVFVGRPDEFPEGIEARHTISYPGGEPAILIVDSLDKVYAKKSF